MSTKSNFCVVAKNNRDYLCSVARKSRVPEHDVEDLVQDALLIAHRRWSTFADQSSPRTWLHGILVNVLLNRRRKSSNYARRLDAYATLGRQRDAGDGEPVIERHELEEFLASLDERTRDVFVKFEIEGYKGREVAEALAINASTAVSWLRNARLALRHRFEPFRRPRPSPSPRAFAKHLTCAAALVAGVWTNRPPDVGTADGSEGVTNPGAMEIAPISTVDRDVDIIALSSTPPAVSERGHARGIRARGPPSPNSSTLPRVSRPVDDAENRAVASSSRQRSCRRAPLCICVARRPVRRCVRRTKTGMGDVPIRSPPPAIPTSRPR